MMMAKKTVSLYLDDHSLRLLVAQGGRVKKWADAPLPAGLIKNGVVTSEAEVADKISLLFKALQLRPGKVIVGISGLHCLSRPITLPQLPDDMLDEAVRREAKANLPVPPDKLYLSWNSIPAPSGKSRVFLVAVPRHIADPLQKTLTRVGLKPYLMDLKPLALARATLESTAILVDVQSHEFDIVIIADGIIHPVRSLSLPGKTVSWPKKLDLIAADLNRTVEFYNTNNPDNLLLSTIPLFVSGELAGKESLHQTLSESIGRPVLPLPSPLACPTAGLDPGYYLPNMGLTLKDMPTAEAGRVTANVNALPVPYRTKPVSLINVLGIPAIVIAAGLLVFLVMLLQAMSADITGIEDRLTDTNRLLDQKQSQRQQLTDRITGLEQDITGAEATGTSIVAAFENLESRSAGIDAVATVVNRLPDAVKLTGIEYSLGVFTLDGRAPSQVEVLAYLKDLDTSGSFAGITIASLTESGDGNMAFTLILKTGD